ncbi:MAG: DNA-3-methyladenine glycosylase family protein [bacterium]
MTKLIRFRNQPILFKLGVDSRQSLQLRFLNYKPDGDLIEFIRNYINEWFDLKTELAPFYGMASKDPILKSLVRQYYGLRIVKIHDLFQALCWAILGQQINLTFAYTLYRRFIEVYGEKYTYRNSTYWWFPQPNAIARVTVADLMKLQLTGKKAEYIIGVAERMKNGDLSRDSLTENNDFDRAKNRLLEIPGVGPWTANYVLLRCLGDPSAFPIEDIGLQNAIKRQLNLSKKPSIEKIRELSTGWKNLEAYATFYLYASFL